MNNHMARFDDLMKQATNDLYVSLDHGTRQDVFHLLMSAADNAGLTVNIEKAAPVSEWNSIFIGSLESLLCTGEQSPAVVAWFKSHNISA